MRRFKNILAVVQDVSSSHGLLLAAMDLAQRNAAQLTLLALTDVPTSSHSIVLHDGTQVDVADLLAEEQRAEIELLATQLDFTDVQTDVEVGGGFVEIIKRVQRDDHDIVFCAPDSETNRLAGSSLAMHLLRKCPVPVWVETPRGQSSPDVAVAIGPFVRDGEHDEVNTRLMELSTSLAVARGGSLHLIHAWRLEGESLLRRGRIRQPAKQVDELVRLSRLESEMNLSRFIEDVEPAATPVVHLAKGRPGLVIPEIVGNLRPGVLVMGTLARTGLKGMFMGNTAEQVLGTVESSVLALKPKGFESPV